MLAVKVTNDRGESSAPSSPGAEVWPGDLHLRASSFLSHNAVEFEHVPFLSTKITKAISTNVTNNITL